MDRGPVTLFGAIVAVGLGPAMWLGAQFGSIEVAPTQPPAVVSEQNAVPDRLLGGTGAGKDDADDSVINATPQSEVVRSTRSASPSPSATRSVPMSPTPSRSSASAEPSRSSGPTTPPTESTPATPASEASSGLPGFSPPSSAGDSASIDAAYR